MCIRDRVKAAGPADAQGLDDQIDDLTVHLLGALGAGIDMAMHTTLIAQIAQIDLQGLQRPATQGREIGLSKQGQGGMHL